MSARYIAHRRAGARRLVAGTLILTVSALAAAPQDAPRTLAFRPGANGQYEFDTGLLRGKLRPAGRALGLSELIHVPSGRRLDRGNGILSHYRLFTTNKRFGTAAWDWPSTSELLGDGAVKVTWPAAEARPFEMTAVYRWSSGATLDLETTVRAAEDLSHFEVFLASYFHQTLPVPYVFVARGPAAGNKPGFMRAEKSFGIWQMFPRDQNVLPMIGDGRWTKPPHPVDWTIMPFLKMPIAARRGPDSPVAAVLMAPPQDCFAIATPYSGEGHYSLYFCLFGRDLKAGQTAKARTRLVVAENISDQGIVTLYRAYTRELAGRVKPPLLP